MSFSGTQWFPFHPGWVLSLPAFLAALCHLQSSFPVVFGRDLLLRSHPLIVPCTVPPFPYFIWCTTTVLLSVTLRTQIKSLFRSSLLEPSQARGFAFPRLVAACRISPISLRECVCAHRDPVVFVGDHFRDHLVSSPLKP